LHRGAVPHRQVELRPDVELHRDVDLHRQVERHRGVSWLPRPRRWRAARACGLAGELHQVVTWLPSWIALLALCTCVAWLPSWAALPASCTRW
jgi:hypothetical protein